MLFLEGLHGLSMWQEAFFWHACSAGSRFDPLCCLYLHHAGGGGTLGACQAGVLDLEQLRRMQNFTRHELLGLERPTLPDFLNAWLTCSRIFAYLGCAPRSVLQACRLSRAATLAVLHTPTLEAPSDSSESSED